MLGLRKRPKMQALIAAHQVNLIRAGMTHDDVQQVA